MSQRNPNEQSRNVNSPTTPTTFLHKPDTRALENRQEIPAQNETLE